MKDGLTDVEMAQEADTAGQPTCADSIAAVRRIVRLTLDDELVTAPSEAEEQANLYRELLKYPRSPELRQHISTRLTQLRALGPNVRMTPLGDVRLGANDAPRSEKRETPCRDCFLIHSGECPERDEPLTAASTARLRWSQLPASMNASMASMACLIS
jgi:hypothetical protein